MMLFLSKQMMLKNLSIFTLDTYFQYVVIVFKKDLIS